MLKGLDTDNPGLEADRGEHAEDQAWAGAPGTPARASEQGQQPTPAWCFPPDTNQAWERVRAARKPACQVPKRLAVSGAIPGPLSSTAPTLAPASEAILFTPRG